MKKVLLIALFWLIAAGCSRPDSPEEVLSRYTDYWKKADYESMYQLFTEETASAWTKEAFAEKYKGILTDIELADLSVSVPEKGIQDNEQTVRIPMTINFSTLAGPVSFEKEAVLKLEETDDGEAWRIDWDPGYVLPSYEESDRVRIQTLEAKRGRIFDRNGSSLAVNDEAVAIGATAGTVTESSKREAAQLLGIDPAFINEQLRASWVQDGYFVPLKTVAKNDAVIANVTALEGMTAAAKPIRFYPYGAAAAHVTGYTGEINAEELEQNKGYKAGDVIGKRGLEQLFENELKETDGKQIFIDKEKGEPVIVARKEPVNGQDVTVSIHAEMQKVLYESMEGQTGTAAAVAPGTGDVLALLSMPSFDPNEFARGVSADRYNALQNDPAKPLLNRFTAAYSPGSTIKPVIAAAAITAGTLNPEDGKTITGLQWQPDSSWGNYHVTRVSAAENPVTLDEAIVTSDNIYFAMTALDTGAEAMAAGLQLFGFGEEVPFVYPLPASQLSNSGTLDSDILLADTGYGQGEVLATMTHLASMYTAFVQDGVMMKPKLVLDEEPSEWKTGLVTKEAARSIRSGLRAVVKEGTGQPANVAGAAIAGKTGTAEIKTEQGTQGQENGLFVSFNNQNPAFVLAMLIEGAENKGGSRIAAERAGQFYETWFTYYQ